VTSSRVAILTCLMPRSPARTAKGACRLRQRGTTPATFQATQCESHRDCRGTMVSRRVDRDQRVCSVAGQLLAAVLRQELDDSGLTKIAFSRKIGVTTQFLDPMLAGSGNPSLITLDTIMRALGRTVVFPRSGAAGEGIESHSARALGLVVQRLAMLMREEIETTVRRKGLTWPAIDAPAGQVQGRRTQVQPILRNGIVYCGPSWIYRTRTAVR